MKHSALRGTRLAVVLLVTAVLTSGCGGGSKKNKIWVYHIPEFYQPDLKRVAVLPFENRTGVRGIADRIGDQVSAILTNNGTYEVYTRQNLKDVLTEQDAVAAGIIEGDLAMKIGRLKSVQALVCGVCNRAETTTRHETRYDTVPVYGTNSQGQTVLTGFKQVPYTWTRHDAFVECQVVVIDTTTGQQIAAVHDPTNLWAEGRPPSHLPPDVLRAAETDQVKRIVREIAVTRTRIKLKGTVLKTAIDFYDQEWDWEKEITADTEQFFLVVKLPAEADRNNFKLTIVPRDGREVLAEMPLVWNKQSERKGFRFKVQTLMDKHGVGEYTAKLYSGAEPIAKYHFKIVEES